MDNPQLSHYFIAMNQGKRNITLDLKTQGAIEVVRRMAASYDVADYQLPPGVLDRLGLGYDVLSAHQPQNYLCPGQLVGA